MDLVKVERAGPGRVALVTLNRPHALNAVNAEMTEQLRRTVLQIENDHTVRAAILTGSGRAFSAGADVKEMEARAAIAPLGPGGFAGFVRAKRSKPWIAALNGPAWGGGAEIALACDFIVASEGASLLFPETRIGLLAAAGGIVALARKLPLPLVLELLVADAALDAARGYQLGLFNRLAQPETLLSVALELALAIEANSPDAVRETMRLARLARAMPEDEAWRLVEEEQVRLGTGPDFAEALAARKVGRPPAWACKQAGDGYGA